MSYSDKNRSVSSTTDMPLEPDNSESILAQIGIKKRLVRGTALNFIAVAFNQGSTLVINIIVARILMLQVFGEYAMVYSTVLTAAMVSQLATGYTASKYIAEYRVSDPQRAGRIMGVCALVAAVTAGVGALALTALAPWLAGTVLKAPHLAFALMLGSGFLFFSAINGYQMGALSGFEAYGSLARAGAASGAATMVAVLVGASRGGLNGALIGLSVGAFIRCVIHNRALRLESRARGIRPQYRDGLREEKEIILKFALPAALAGFYSMPMIWLANSVLVRQPGGYGQMAIYAAASSIRVSILVVPQVINNVSLSILNNVKGTGDVPRYKRVYRSNVFVVLLATLIGALIIGLFGSHLLSIFGKDFAGGGTVLRVLLLSTIFEGVSIALYQHLQAQAKLWSSFFLINMPRETLFVLLAFLLVPMQGALGLSVAYAICWLLTLVIICLLINREQKLEKRPVAY